MSYGMRSNKGTATGGIMSREILDNVARFSSEFSFIHKTLQLRYSCSSKNISSWHHKVLG